MCARVCVACVLAAVKVGERTHGQNAVMDEMLMILPPPFLDMDLPKPWLESTVPR